MEEEEGAGGGVVGDCVLLKIAKAARCPLGTLSVRFAWKNDE